MAKTFFVPGVSPINGGTIAIGGGGGNVPAAVTTPKQQALAAQEFILEQIQFVTVVVPAQSTITVQIAGDQVFVETVTPDFSPDYTALNFKPDSGNPVLRLPPAGRGIRLPVPFRSLDLINTNVKAISLGLYVGFGSVDIATGGANSPIYTAENVVAISSSQIQRPNNVTPYAAGQVVSTSLGAYFNFTEMARTQNGTARIIKALLMKSGATVTNAVFRLYLLQGPGTAAGVDQSAFSVPYPTGFVTPGNQTAVLNNMIAGIVDFPFMASEGGGGGAACEVELDLSIITAQSRTDLNGILVAQAAYVPAAQENFFVILTSARN